MSKVLINTRYGGFCLSPAAFARFCELKGEVPDDIGSGFTPWGHGIERDDPALIQAVEEIGLDASSQRPGELEIVEIPKGERYIIHEYDGNETIKFYWDFEWRVG